ncbi:MAG: hypothetical protein M1825_001678 [Sarcosagium campestre]|nr:MAG: hypothetical protein M1825_001678 [Sarcosagium campestre]
MSHSFPRHLLTPSSDDVQGVGGPRASQGSYPAGSSPPGQRPAMPSPQDLSSALPPRSWSPAHGSSSRAALPALHPPWSSPRESRGYAPLGSFGEDPGASRRLSPPRAPTLESGARSDERLPAISQLLTTPTESKPAPRNRMSYSPRQSAAPSGTHLSPGQSPPARLSGLEPGIMEGSPLQERRGVPRAPYTLPAVHERSSATGITSAPSRGPDASLHRQSPSYSEGHRPDSSYWSPRSDHSTEHRQPASVRAVSAGHTPQAGFRSPGIGEPTQNPDILGPSIWTGTHFLPRFVGERLVPGEGVCYFYDDGTYCKTVIEGEAVNAHWGVTKAGKPRKRLAVACLTCREKKIKCDPDFPRCVQCEKFGRTCKFKNAPRGQRVSPDSYTYEGSEPASRAKSPKPMHAEEDGASQIKILRSPYEMDEKALLRKRRSSLELSPRSASSSDFESREHSQRARHTLKRPRTSSPTELLHPLPTPREPKQATMPARTSFSSDLFGSGILNYPSVFAWQKDPYEINSELVMHLMTLYFDHAGTMTCGMLPRGPFMHWLGSCRGKTQDDLMLVYSALTLASAFSSRSDRKFFSKEFARIARYAVDSRWDRYSAQLVQSRILLSLHYSASDKLLEAWDLSGAAVRTAVGLELMLEDPSKPMAENADSLYNLTSFGTRECRRRTFWAAYLLDVQSYNGDITATCGSSLQAEDILVRFPCDEQSYENQTESDAPFVSDWMEEGSSRQASPTVGSTAFLVQIAIIWQTVLTQVQRTARRPAGVNRSTQAAFRERTLDRLADWLSSLPSELAATTDNIDAAASNGTLGNLAVLHALYHDTVMMLCRYDAQTESSSASKSLSLAYTHAQSLLQLVHRLLLRRQLSGTQMVVPFLGQAVTRASDILTARLMTSPPTTLTSMTTIAAATTTTTTAVTSASLELVESTAPQLLAELKTVWPSARVQSATVQLRIDEIKTHFARTGNADATPYEAKRPLISTSALIEIDLVYATSTDVYLEAASNASKDASASSHNEEMKHMI